jgi:DNA-binding LytR/AlgR family response regulator
VNALIVDDEQPAREELGWLLEQCDGVRVAAEASDAERAREELQERGDAIDVVFLDIDMPGVDGIRFAECLGDLDTEPATVFVTAYDDYAVDAFDVEAVDYLLKPVRLERLQEAVERVSERLDSDRTHGDADVGADEPDDDGGDEETLDRVSVQADEGYRVVDLDEILYFESDDGEVFVETTDGRFATDFSLKFLESRLPSDEFFRCHRSYIVRLGAIDTIVPAGAGTYRLFVDDPDDPEVTAERASAPLARSRAAELKRRMPWSASAIGE